MTALVGVLASGSAMALSSLEVKLAKQADDLFRQGKILEPADDNAYLRYRALQILNPDSVEAKSGLDAILVNEIEFARQSLGRSRISLAKQRLKHLQQLFPGSTLLREFESEFEAYVKKRKKPQPAKPKARVPDRTYLNESLLAQKDPAIVQQLTSIAQKVESSKESVLIYARTDADGRWIYAQMRKAVPDYRIRGDIRIGEPAIKLLPPLD